MSALFACTRCAKRFPFEDLSEVDQLCKECRNNFPVVKCTYCRSEFQQNDKNGVNSICRKCAHNVKAYGKPRACEYCNIIAAFIGRRCQRCSNSEKRWGAPKICEQCKQQCAFERGTDTRKRVEGKLLCWLCTMSYRRVLVKTKKAKEFTRSMTHHKSSSSSHDRTGGGPSASASGKSGGALFGGGVNLSQGSKFKVEEEAYSPGSGFPGDDNTQSSNTPYSPGSGIGSNLLEDTAKSSAANTPSGRSDHLTPGSSSQLSWSKESKDYARSSSSTMSFKHKLTTEDENRERLADLKKMKMEKSANGVSIIKSSSMSDFVQSENMVQLTQMKEKIESLKKQMAAKDAQLLEKDKKITELRAFNFEAEKKMRERIDDLQKGHQSALNTLQTRNRELMRQVQMLGKSGKKSS